MATRFAQAAEQHFRALVRVAGETGHYARGGSDVEIEGVRGNAGVDGTLVEDTSILDSDAQWIFRKSDLVIDAKPIIPAPDDTWRVTLDNGKVEHFEVLPPIHGERCWQPFDHAGAFVRVFMKLRRTEQPNG